MLLMMWVKLFSPPPEVYQGQSKKKYLPLPSWAIVTFPVLLASEAKKIREQLVWEQSYKQKTDRHNKNDYTTIICCPWGVPFFWKAWQSADPVVVPNNPSTPSNKLDICSSFALCCSMWKKAISNMTMEAEGSLLPTELCVSVLSESSAGIIEIDTQIDALYWSHLVILQQGIRHITHHANIRTTNLYNYE